MTRTKQMHKKIRAVKKQIHQKHVILVDVGLREYQVCFGPVEKPLAAKYELRGCQERRVTTILRKTEIRRTHFGRQGFPRNGVGANFVECFLRRCPASYIEIVYADDLNAYRVFPSTTPNANVKNAMKSGQDELHQWGRADQVSFDPSKESRHILSLSEPWGDDFKILGVLFDATLSMERAVGEVVVEAGWKLRMLIRTRRFYTDRDLVLLYKAYLLSFLECRTPAVYHARRNVLEKLDRVQSKFLDDLGIPQVTALMEFNLAPLAARRDMAMLGLVHRAVLGKGPSHFRKLFSIGPDGNLVDTRSRISEPLAKRSALGLVPVYNLLPDGIRSAKEVHIFQKRLQSELKLRAEAGVEQWENTYSPRMSLDKHPLQQDGSTLLTQLILDQFFEESD